MRVIDILTESFLTEAALKKADFYLRDRLASLIKRLIKKDNFLKVDGSYVKIKASGAEIANLKRLYSSNYDGKGVAIDKSLFPATLGGVVLSQLVKTNDLGGKSVSAEGEESIGNLGPTVEALKSMAIFAKLIARKKSEITPADVIKIGKLLKTRENIVNVVNPDTGVASKTPTSVAEYSKTIDDIRQPPEGGIKDKISIKINVSTPSFNRAVEVNENDKKAWGTLQGIVTYVNTEGDLGRYSRFFANNVKRDPIHIAVVGLSGAKTDIKTVYDDGVKRFDKEGNAIERTLPHLNMSIKAGSDMYDQASGNTLEGTFKFFNILGLSDAQANSAIEATKFMEKPRKKKGDADEPRAVLDARKAAVRQMYAIAAQELDNEISSMTDKEEGSFIHRLLMKLTNSIQGKGRLLYVNFDPKGNYYKLNPQQIIQLAKFVDLGVHFDPKSKTEPHLYIKDMKSGKSIFHVRPAILKSGRITHTFELDHLLDLVKNRTNNQPEAPATAPIDTTPVVPKDTVTPATKVKSKPRAPEINTSTNTDPNQSLNNPAVPNSTNPNDHIPFATQ